MLKMSKAVFRRGARRSPAARSPGAAPAQPPATASGGPLPLARSRLYGSHIGVAIRSRTLLQLRYGDDSRSRLFAPYLVYRSASGQTNVIGSEIHSEPVLNVARCVTLDVMKIRALRNTPVKFVAPADFEPQEPLPRDGIISSVF